MKLVTLVPGVDRELTSVVKNVRGSGLALTVDPKLTVHVGSGDSDALPPIELQAKPIGTAKGCVTHINIIVSKQDTVWPQTIRR